MKKIVTYLLAVLLAAVSAGNGFAAKQNGLDLIKKSGVLRVGVKGDIPRFSYLNPETNQYEGLEIDIAKEVAKKIFGSDSRIEFVQVNAKTRGPFLKNDKVDMVIATFTVTEERKNEYDFSDVYYTDAVGIMVKKASGITSFRDLENKTVGVSQGSITKTTIKNAAIREGILVKTQDYASYPLLKAALDSGEIDAFSVDQAILLGYMDDSVTILPEHYDEQMYAVAIRKDNTPVTKLVNEVIRDLVKSGGLDSLLKKNGLKF